VEEALRVVGIPDTRENGCHALKQLYASTLRLPPFFVDL